MTRMEIQESNRLRVCVLRHGWPYSEIAAVVQLHKETVKAWMAGRALLYPTYQNLLKQRFPEETR